MSKKLLIAIDGPSSSGKGTIAKQIAHHFNLPCLNSGALYRLTAYLAVKNDLNVANDQDKILLLIKDLDLTDVDLESCKLHNEDIGQKSSIIAQNQHIRQELFDLQRNFALQGLKTNNGAILEGRDIGTVICPDANYKFYITASAQERAKRRYQQLLINGQEKVQYRKILSQLKTRDKQDKNRKNSPLIKAADAMEIDSSKLTIEQVFQRCVNHININ